MRLAFPVPIMPDEDDTPLLMAPLVAIVATVAVLFFAQIVPHIRDSGALPTWSSLASFLGQ